MAEIKASPQDPEDWAAIGQRLAWGGQVVPAAVGFRSVVGINNKSTPNRPSLIVVTHQQILFGATTSIAGIRYLVNANTLIGTKQAAPRDLTLGGAGTNLGMPTGVIVTDNTQTLAALGGLVVSQGIGGIAGTPIEYWEPIVIGPGSTIFWEAGSDNVAIGGTFWWREFDLSVSIA